jgi:hypothetical protein
LSVAKASWDSFAAQRPGKGQEGRDPPAVKPGCPVHLALSLSACVCFSQRGYLIYLWAF